MEVNNFRQLPHQRGLFFSRSIEIWGPVEACSVIFLFLWQTPNLSLLAEFQNVVNRTG